MGKKKANRRHPVGLLNQHLNQLGRAAFQPIQARRNNENRDFRPQNPRQAAYDQLADEVREADRRTESLRERLARLQRKVGLGCAMTCCHV